MKVTIVLASLIASAAAFAPTQQASRAVTFLNAKDDAEEEAAPAPAPAKKKGFFNKEAKPTPYDDMDGVTKPLGFWDPLNLAGLGSDSTLAWFRAAELKHGRVAMLATTGYLVQAAGFHFPGMLSKDVSFESLSTMKPFDAWAAMPEGGKCHRNSISRRLRLAFV